MRRTTALRDLLSDLTVVFNDGDRVPVDFDDSSYATESGEIRVAPAVRKLYGSLTGGEEMRIVSNTVSHEIEHIRESDLDSKRLFMADNPDMPNVAGAVINILEDQYVDWNRTRRFPGLRGAHAFSIDRLMCRRVRPRIDTLDREQAMVEGLLQVAFAGFAKGIADADDDVRDFLARAVPHIDAVRTEHDRDARYSIAADVMSLFREYVDDKNAADAAADDLPELNVMRDADGDDPTDADDVDADDVDSIDADDADAADAADVDAGDADTDDVDSIDADDADDADDAGVDADDADTDDVDSIDADELERTLAELESRDETGDVGDWYDLETDAWRDADELDEMRYERVRDETEATHDVVDSMRQKRENAIDHFRDERENRWENTLSENIRGAMEASGLVDEIVTAFRKLKTRDEPMPSRSGQRANVRAHNRMLAGNTSARNELYLRQETIELGDRSVNVVLDMSGSMSEIDAKIALAAIATACRVIGDDFSACAFRGNTSKRVDLVTAPDEKFDWDHLDGTGAGGNTPTASGVEFGRAMLRKSTKPDKVMFVVTDGRANRNLENRATGAMGDARHQIESAKRDDVTVIGIGVGGVYESDMNTLFGQDGFVMTDMDDLADALVRVYDSQMKVGSALN